VNPLTFMAGTVLNPAAHFNDQTTPH